MPLAEYQDLCLDVTDIDAVAPFWSGVLGGEIVRRDDGWTHVRCEPLVRLWLNAVPEAKVAKNRVHLDVRSPSIDPLLAVGGTVLAEHDGWTVLADPEGNELCWFPGDVTGSGAADPFAICVDSSEPEALAAWWQQVLGGEVRPGPDGTPRWLHGAAGLGDVILKCVRVSDERTVKNRSHWDVRTDDLAALIALGGTVLAEPGEGHPWTVLADPQGNEFCAFTG